MRLLTAMHPTDNQKRVLAKIAAAPTPTVAASEISADANLVAARNLLMKLGMITYTDGNAEMTDQGRKVATDENIIDQGGELTQAGQQLAYSDSQGQQTPDNGASPPAGADAGLDSMAGPDDMGGAPGGDPFSMESYQPMSLLKELLG
jgi:phage gp45-like